MAGRSDGISTVSSQPPFTWPNRSSCGRIPVSPPAGVVNVISCSSVGDLAPEAIGSRRPGPATARRNRRSTNPEAGLSGRLLIAHVDPGDLGAGWPVLRPVDEGVDRVGIPLEH